MPKTLPKPKPSAQSARPSRNATPANDRCVKDRLLDAANRLFYAEGIEQVGIERILEEAGAAKASLYQHYGSKAELVKRYLESRAELTRPALADLLGWPGIAPRDRLLLLFDFAVEHASRRDYRGCPFQNASRELADPAHPAIAVVCAQHAWLKAAVGAVVAEAPALAQMPQLAEALVTLYDGALISAQMQQSPGPCHAARWAAEQLLAGAEGR